MSPDGARIWVEGYKPTTGDEGEVKRLIAYLWPFTSYRDVNRGSMMEQAAAARHNQQLASALPIYINRWAISASLELILAEITPVLLAAVFAILFALSFCMIVQMVRVWLEFKRY
jgi:hypothetical protein